MESVRCSTRTDSIRQSINFHRTTTTRAILNSAPTAASTLEMA